ALLVRYFRSRSIDLCLGWFWSVACSSVRLRQCHSARHTLGDVHVHHSRRANLVRVRLGNATARDWVPVDLSLPVARWSSVSEMPAAAPGDLAFSLAWSSHHDWCWPYHVARRSMLACFDDALLRRSLPRLIVQRAEHAAQESEPSRINYPIAIGLFSLVAYLSIGPVANLVSERQMMNTSFDRLSLVNTCGAFGAVGKERDEIVFEGTDDTIITGDTKWKEYEFKAKPGDPNRRPPFVAPYQPRIDWQIWFAAMASPAEYPWTLHFVWKLLHNDSGTLSLLANNPFPVSPPHYIRARLYRYRFAPPGDPAWWKREPIGEWLPALSIDDEQ